MTAEGIYPASIWRPPVGAAADKHGYPGYSEPSRKVGIVCHSMEGSLAAALGELDKVTRRASWTFSNPKVGPILQHFPVGQHTWASGSLQANVLYTSCEHEGVAGEPLTENQIANDVALFRWLHDQHEWGGYGRRIQLWEHNEAVAKYGGGATACPSHRIPWLEIIKRLEGATEVDFMKGFAWVTTDAKPYKTWIVGPTPQGLRRSWVKSVEEEDALRAAGLIGFRVTKITDAQLACYAEG